MNNFFMLLGMLVKAAQTPDIYVTKTNPWRETVTWFNKLPENERGKILDMLRVVANEIGTNKLSYAQQEARNIFNVAMNRLAYATNTTSPLAKQYKMQLYGTKAPAPQTLPDVFLYHPDKAKSPHFGRYPRTQDQIYNMLSNIKSLSDVDTLSNKQVANLFKDIANIYRAEYYGKKPPVPKGKEPLFFMSKPYAAQLARRGRKHYFQNPAYEQLDIESPLHYYYTFAEPKKKEES